MTKNKKKIKIKPGYKHRVPHRPTKVHEDKRLHSRKGRQRDIIMKEILEEMKEDYIAEAEKYSVWLMPEGDVYRRLSDLITNLSDKHLTPDFEPHVTLIDGLVGPETEMIDKTKTLANTIHPFIIKLTAVEYLDEYYRCLFLRAEKENTLIDANLKAQEIFGKEKIREFMPHLSLMYGDFEPKIKEEIISGIGRDFNISFDVKNIYLFSTEGQPDDWFSITKFPLE